MPFDTEHEDEISMPVDKPTPNTWKKQINQAGEFVRRPTTFRHAVSADGSTGFRAEPARYHLYVSYACPWAHRTLLVRALKGLNDVISFDVVDTFLQAGGWRFSGEEAGATGDRVNQFDYLSEAYAQSDESYRGAITVPVLWDKRGKKIVNNESSEIIRQLNSEFNSFSGSPDLDLYPAELRSRIDEINAWVYPAINNGVYRAGFARSQKAYDRAVNDLFEALDRAESLLSRSRYLTGSSLTEADLRLWPTLVRFDLVYHTHFKCNVRRIVDYPNLWAFVRDIYALPGVKETLNTRHIVDHYYRSHEVINPHRIVPRGPDLDFSAAHDRDRFA